MPLDDAATELLRRIDRETLSHLMLKAGMHTYPPRLVVASREELVRLAVAGLGHIREPGLHHSLPKYEG